MRAAFRCADTLSISEKYQHGPRIPCNYLACMASERTCGGRAFSGLAFMRAQVRLAFAMKLMTLLYGGTGFDELLSMLAVNVTPHTSSFSLKGWRYQLP